MAIKSFSDQTTADVFHKINSKDARRVPQVIWKTARRKMDALHAAKQTADLAPLGFKPLPWDKPGFSQIKINDQYRLVFRFDKGDAFDVGIQESYGA